MAKKCRVIAIASSKGGVGKSTIATNLAVETARAGLEVLLVDTDPQASSTLFATTRSEDRPAFRTIQMTKPILHREIPKLSEPYDLAFLDTGGRETTTFRSALAAADLILVPVIPSAYDIWASEDVFTVIDEITATRDGVRTRVVLNQVVSRTKIAREALDALTDMAEEQGALLLDTCLHFRVAWKMATSAGLAVTEWQPRGAAAEELRSLVREIELIPEADSGCDEE